MAALERIIARLKTLQAVAPGELLRSPRLDVHPAYEAGRMAGVIEGIDRALSAVEQELGTEEDERTS